jgi:hypothetical protein
VSFERCLAFTKFPFKISIFSRVKPEKNYETLVENRLKKTTYEENSKFISNWPAKGEIKYENYSV